jgi:uncharacterized protein YutE (UPF0331/DUF86 family)
VICRRLAKLEQYLRILGKLQLYDFETFIEDPEHDGSAERFVQLAIEALLDLGNRVIAELALGTVESCRDIPIILAEHRYVDDELKE